MFNGAAVVIVAAVAVVAACHWIVVAEYFVVRKVVQHCFEVAVVVPSVDCFELVVAAVHHTVASSDLDVVELAEQEWHLAVADAAAAADIVEVEPVVAVDIVGFVEVEAVADIVGSVVVAGIVHFVGCVILLLGNSVGMIVLRDFIRMGTW